MVDLDDIKSIDDIQAGHLPGYFFPKLIELGHLAIEPFSEDSLGNICYYLHFNNKFRKPRNNGDPVNLLSKESIEDAFEPYREMNSYLLEPGKSVITQTYERVGASDELLCKMENTSALARVLLNHTSHGFLHPSHGIDNPFHLMIEITNLGEKHVEITPAKNEAGRIVGPDAFRFYVEKLPYKTNQYSGGGSVPKLKMDIHDRS